VPRGNNVPLGLLIEASSCAIIHLFNHPNKSLNTDCGGIMGEDYANVFRFPNAAALLTIPPKAP
jgi:hypothetical protein